MSTPQQSFHNAADIDQLLQDRFEYHYAEDLPYNTEQQFLIDALEESQPCDDEQRQEEQLNALNLQRLNRAGKTRAGAEGPPEGETATAGAWPPITNRGVSKYLDPQSPSETVPRTLAELIDSRIVGDTLQQGGYDGGVLMGFDGSWNPNDFENLLKALENKRQTAESSDYRMAEIRLADVPFVVKPSGAKDGAYYRYVFEGAGLKFYLHHNPQAKIQPIRLRYGAEALIGRDLFSLHQGVLAFLNDIGFTVHKEKLSRVDMRILTDWPMLDIVRLICSGHAVSRGRKREMHETGVRFETYTTGSRESVQLCLYDKKAEIINLMASDPVKFCLMLDHCVGDWIFENRAITRIEFRLARAALKAMAIDSVEDLREKEAALVDWLTSHWFRLLDAPKVRGHENKAKMHENWDRVRECFRLYFPGPEGRGKPVRWQRRESLSCDVTALLKQAAGCLASAAALCGGGIRTESRALDCMLEMLEPMRKEIAEKANAKAELLNVVKGVRLGK